MSHDVVIAGAGAAGVSAALWARSLGLSVVLLEEGAEPGGQLHHVHFEIGNFAGSLPGMGQTLVHRMNEQLAAQEIDVRYRTPAASLDPKAPAVRLGNGESLDARSILIATGARKRMLDVPGARELFGRGISDSATRDRQTFAGEEMLVVGGGDAAFENALILADVGCRVTIAVRDAGNARREFRERVARVTADRSARTHDGHRRARRGSRARREARRLARQLRARGRGGGGEDRHGAELRVVRGRSRSRCRWLRARRRALRHVAGTSLGGWRHHATGRSQRCGLARHGALAIHAIWETLQTP
jgi:pyruvate/2-oxoglutarate dehydrogenase complex dihydrolipoamide dehydrogenase (E3) component